jgi:DNA-binding XRE family transcriptional regulator
MELRNGLARGGAQRHPADGRPRDNGPCLRLSPEQRVAVMEMERANPEATQAEIARKIGVSRASVSPIEGGRRRGARTAERIGASCEGIPFAMENGPLVTTGDVGRPRRFRR